MAATTNSLSSLLFATLLLSSLLSLSMGQTQKGAMQARPMSMITQFLNPHNKIRAQPGLPPLKWSLYLSNFAKLYANKWRGECALIHSTGDSGENIFWGKGNGWKPSDAVVAWAAEKPFYNYKFNRCLQNRDCLLYTQMVWRTTKMIGCCHIVCNSGNTFINCNYYPHGNVIGQRPY